MSKRRVQFTPTPQVDRLLDRVLEGGLHGRSRSAVVERLVCRQLEGMLGSAVLPVEATREKRRQPWER